ncbi:hypothetical protein FRC00_003713 [Tulasnella sp. 408]|nr:hypothetical protein FRC00_003713 [Tulasnella sp. 408]
MPHCAAVTNESTQPSSSSAAMDKSTMTGDGIVSEESQQSLVTDDTVPVPSVPEFRSTTVKQDIQPLQNTDSPPRSHSSDTGHGSRLIPGGKYFDSFPDELSTDTLSFPPPQDIVRSASTQLKAIDARTQKDQAYWKSWQERRPGVSTHLDPSPRPLRLLSLDGGGVRGIISLIILEQIMNETAPNAKPCEWFDLIGGTSTGGWIAIMLGRLRMSIRDCIAAYCELAKDVFDVNLFDAASGLLSGHRFSGDKLQQAVEKVVQRHKGATSTKMWDSPDRRSETECACRTFVVAIPGRDVPRPAKLFRTYNNRFQGHFADQCQIWEAARATSCAPSVFPDIQVEGVNYSDGGLGNNNPTQLVLQEAQSLWGPDQQIGCLLSLGTGSVDSFMRRFNTPLDFVNILGIFKRIALSCNAVHEELRSNQLVTPFYYRFNPTMNAVSFDEWKKIPELEDIAQRYLADNRREVAEFARAMCA